MTPEQILEEQNAEYRGRDTRWADGGWLAPLLVGSLAAGLIVIIQAVVGAICS
jgi:hypothetical protein